MTQAYIEVVLRMSLQEAVDVQDSLFNDGKDSTADVCNLLDDRLKEAAAICAEVPA